MTDKYIAIKELADLKGVSTRAIRLTKNKYKTREITVKGGKSFEILLSSIEPIIEEKIMEETVPKTIKPKKLTQRQEQMNKPVFTNKNEKFEWLMEFGCTSSDDRAWLREYKKSEGYKNLYET